MDARAFISFEKLVTTKYVTELFWIGVAVSVLAGIGLIISDFYPALLGAAVLVGGPVLTRIGCELLVLAFKVVDWVAEIRTLLAEQQQTAGPPPSRLEKDEVDAPSEASSEMETSSPTQAATPPGP